MVNIIMIIIQESNHNNYNNMLLSKLAFNPLMTTLQPQSNGPPYSNTVIGTVTGDV